MAVLVIYATKTGATAQCINILAEEIPNCTTCNIEIEKPAIEEFDTIILGAGVRDGKIYKLIRDFIKKKSSCITGKKNGLLYLQRETKGNRGYF